MSAKAGKESSGNKKQDDAELTNALLKILETLPAETSAFLQPAFAPPKVKERKPVGVPPQASKTSKPTKSVAEADGVSLGHVELMVAKKINDLFGSCSMIENMVCQGSLLLGSLLQNMTAEFGSHIIFDLADQSRMYSVSLRRWEESCGWCKLSHVYLHRRLAVCQTSRSSGERRGLRQIL